MSNIGLKDLPIAEQGEESLGLQEYADALAEFVKSCDTPMTIALQGDWGSGKTSLMNLIKQQVEPEKQIRTVWFNTWQYSQFDMGDTLALSLFSSLIDELAPPKERSRLKSVLEIVWRVAKPATIAAGGLLGHGDTVKSTVNAAEESFAAGKPGHQELDPAAKLRLLKSALEEVVLHHTSNGDRVVVFVDDLDRLLPARAVELLESLKLFLDLPGCVFVLACDYNVVTKGLKQKFGVGEAELDGKSFFDKMIQVPFNMPLSQYKVEAYFATLLKRIRVEYEKPDLQLYRELVDYSIGFNPRSMKRLFNSLLLLRLVAQRKQLFGAADLSSTRSETMRVLFAILCLQHAYEPVYSYVLSSDLSQAMFERLREHEQLCKDGSLESLRQELEFTEDNPKLRRLADFMGAFYDAIQLDEDGDDEHLSPIEQKTLRAILSFSSVVSTEGVAPTVVGGERYSNRELAKQLVGHMNEKLAPKLANTASSHGFTHYQPRGVDYAATCIWPLVLGAKGQRLVLACWYFHDRIEIQVGAPKRELKTAKSWVNQHLRPLYPNNTRLDYYGYVQWFRLLDRQTFQATDSDAVRAQAYYTMSERFFERVVEAYLRDSG